MYNIQLLNMTPKNVYTELIDVFLRPDEYRCTTEADFLEVFLPEKEHLLVFDGKDHHEDRNLIKQSIYRELSELTGKAPEWGILTGIRPVKVAGELLHQLGNRTLAKAKLTDYFLVSEDKAEQILDMYEGQIHSLGNPQEGSTGVYIGIPFCPSRCLYCSFTSNQGTEKQIREYLEALHLEIAFVGSEMKRKGLFPESLYFGGGTPTTISAEQLDELLTFTENHLDLSKCSEITVEAGRPDTITKEKLDVIARHSVNRISINPQSMKNSTLELIGRNHDSEQIREAFASAREAKIGIINADLIAGLPGETPQDFRDSLLELIQLGAENITVHTLAVKRASRLIALDPQYHYKQEEAVREMLVMAEKILEENQYRPYYLYRQKHMAGGLENIGYCKGSTEGIYNVRIMDEHQTIIALGAGGITKVYYPDEDRLERVPNVSNYEIYIQRIEEMIERKKDNLF